MTDKIIPDMPEDMESTAKEHGFTSVVERQKRFSLMRVAIFIVVLLVVLVGVFLWVKGREQSAGPTLKSVVLEQQQTIVQLRDSVNSLQQARDTQAQSQQDLAGGLSAVRDALAQQADRLANTASKDLSGELEALSQRVDELSASVDTRFEAALEKQQELEKGMEAVRKLRATSQPRQSASTTTRQRRPAPPSPSFSIAGSELRGGRHYLAISSGPATRLRDLRLLGVGESLGAWRLASIDGHSAAFSINGQTVVMPVP
ncbi:hypothetical protein [Salinicola peritrichatus]|uniref:hypothetical protein n=1 Tax=Salinicola peritrichatus TaxID=1267424 RepID=UPI000DA12984|nr:hypothetical protein [Salinicola peritrichatus]